MVGILICCGVGAPSVVALSEAEGVCIEVDEDVIVLEG
jgi:hypothetical protein